MTIPIQICKYCQKDAIYVPLTSKALTAKGAGVSSNSRTLIIHFCEDCLAEYVYWSKDGELASLHLYTTINDKMYRWTTYPTRAVAFLSYVEDPGIPGLRPNQKVQTLQKFTDFPDITPSNINEKVRAWLPFL